MDFSEARKAVADADRSDRDDRAHRLAELSDLLPDDLVGTIGEAADLLFEDVKATWIYGYFAATTVVAAAFCVQQLAGMVRLQPIDSSVPEVATSLEEVAALAQQRGVIDMDLRTRLVALHDAAQVYSAAGLRREERKAEQHALDADRFSDQDSLIEDARTAVRCSVDVLYR